MYSKSVRLKAVVCFPVLDSTDRWRPNTCAALLTRDARGACYKHGGVPTESVCPEGVFSSPLTRGGDSEKETWRPLLFSGELHLPPHVCSRSCIFTEIVQLPSPVPSFSSISERKKPAPEPRGGGETAWTRDM